MPAGMNCTGGASGNLCLASFKTTAGFGNCVVVSQGAGAVDAAASQPQPRQNEPVRNGAAKGVRFAIPADPPQPSGSDPKNGGDKGKSATKPTDTAARRMTLERNCTPCLIRLPFCGCD